jgi:hypothetical protein
MYQLTEVGILIHISFSKKTQHQFHSVLGNWVKIFQPRNVKVDEFANVFMNAPHSGKFHFMTRDIRERYSDKSYTIR